MGKKKMKKREFIKNSAKLATAGISFPYVIGCKPSKDDDSDLEFLNWSSWQVDPHPNREPSVQQLNFLQNAKGEMNESKLKQLASKAAALPDAYLQYLSEAYNQGFFVEVNRFGEGWAGLCQLGDPPGFVKIELSSVNSGHVFNHECGHALMYATFKGVGGTQNSEGLLSKVYSNAQSSAEGSAAWDYAMKNYREYWACGTSSYYASQACRDDLRQNYNIAWEYFSKALAAPPTDQPFGSASGIQQQPADPNALPYNDRPYDPNSTRPPAQPGVFPPANNANSGILGNTGTVPGLGQLQQTLEQFMAFQMQRQYQQMQYMGYGLTQSKEAKIDNIHDGMEINAGEREYIEIVPGYRDLTELQNYNVFLKDPDSKRHIELPSNFQLDVVYIPGGHAWSVVTIPSHEKIAELVGNKFTKDATGIPSTKLDIVVTDKNKNVIDTRRVLYAKDHADGGKELARLGSPQAFAQIHKSKYNFEK